MLKRNTGVLIPPHSSLRSNYLPTCMRSRVTPLPDHLPYILQYPITPRKKQCLWKHHWRCCIISFGWIPGVWILCADVSEHSVFSIFIGCVGREKNRDEICPRNLFPVILLAYTTCEDGTECSETSTHKIQTPGIHRKEKKCNIQNTAKFRNQE